MNPPLGMTVENDRTGPRLLFVYAAGESDSGQRAASEIAAEGMRSVGWRVETVETPCWNATRSTWLAFPSYLLRLFLAWHAFLWRSRGVSAIHLNIGLTWTSLIREGLPFWIRSRLMGRRPRTTVALHGNLISGWKPRQKRTRWLRYLLRRASILVILGPTHHAHVRRLRLCPESKVTQVPNTASIAEIPEAELEAKLSSCVPLRILFLSSLIPEKGYLAVLDAVQYASQAGDGEGFDPPIEVTICGRFTSYRGQRNLKEQNLHREHLLERIAQCNRRPGVTARFVEGAHGQDKVNLFRESHLFVFPSRYPVESQPLVLLEAMASGCAIVSSAIGDIPVILDDESAVLLGTLDRATITEAILRVANNADFRSQLARNALERYRTCFNHAAHLRRWQEIFGEARPT